MEVRGYGVEHSGAGFVVNIRVWVGTEEVEGVDLLAAPHTLLSLLGPAKVEETVEDADPEEKPQSVRRGRRRDAEPESRDSDENPTEEPAPSVSRRGRRHIAASEDTSDAKDDAGETAPSRRGRRTSRTTSTKSGSSSDAEEVTDEDITKAVSHAAERVGPDMVMDLLSEFGVTKSVALDAEQRVEFLAQLDNLEA